jgi:hypothetical protein
MGRAVTKTTSNDGKTSSSPKTLQEVTIKPKAENTVPKVPKGSKVQYQGGEGMLGGNMPKDVFTSGEDTRSMKEKTGDPKNDPYYGMRHPNADLRKAKISDEDQEMLRKELRAGEDQDIELSQSMYDAWKKAGKTGKLDKFQSDFKSKEEFDKYNPYHSAGSDWGFSEGLSGSFTKRDPERAKRMSEAKAKAEQAARVKAVRENKQYPTVTNTKEVKTKEDINVPQVVEGPAGRTKSKRKLEFGYKDTIARKLNAPLKTKPVNWEDTDLIERMSGLQKPKTNWSRRGIKRGEVTSVPKNARLSERMKYKKEEKLAGARERVLGQQGVALENQVNKYGKYIERGQNLQEGSAQRLKDLKGKLGVNEEFKKAPTDPRDIKGRKASLKEAKSDVKQIGKLSREQAKATRATYGKKGEAMVKAKSMMAEAKSAAKPKKFSKDTSAAGLAKDLEAMKSAKSPAEIKAMKSSARTAMKEARGMKRTAEEKSAIKSSVKATRGIAKEARSLNVRSDVRKGLRLGKKDLRGMNASDLASKAKKDKLAAKGKTLKGTGYFTMDNLNKRIKLSEASGVSKYKEPKLTRAEQKKFSKNGRDTLGVPLAEEIKRRTSGKEYTKSQGFTQAGSKRFVKKK